MSKSSRNGAASHLVCADGAAHPDSPHLRSRLRYRGSEIALDRAAVELLVEELGCLAWPPALSVTAELAGLLERADGVVVDLGQAQRDVLVRAVDHVVNASPGSDALFAGIDWVLGGSSVLLTYVLVHEGRVIDSFQSRSGPYQVDDRLVDSSGRSWLVVATETGEPPVLRVTPWSTRQG